MLNTKRPIRTGIAIACLSGCLFTAIAVNALVQGPLASLDTWVALDMRDADQQGLIRTLMVALTSLGSVVGMTLLCSCGVAWHVWRGRNHWRTAAGWAFVMLAGALLIFGAKELFQRARPPLDWRDPVAMETNPSFPSGHAMGATMGFGFLGYALCLGQNCRRRRFAIALLLGALVVGIGVSRIYLRAHWLSDVVAGFALGLAWLSLCIGFLAARKTDKETGRQGDKEIEILADQILPEAIA